MDHSVDTFLEAHECTVSSEVANLALDLFANWVTGFDLGPWVLFELANAEGDFLLLGADSQHNCGDLLIEFKHIAGARDALDPGKLGNVNETFDTLFDFDKGTVWKKLGDFSRNLGSHWKAGFDVLPWVVGHLLETK